MPFCWFCHVTAHETVPFLFSVPDYHMSFTIKQYDVCPENSFYSSYIKLSYGKVRKRLWLAQYAMHKMYTFGLLLFEPGHEKMCLMPYANNKGADQPAHPRSLINAFVVRCLDSIISLDSPL